MNEQKNNCWPGWETVRLIGRGSFGAVYEIQRDMLGDVEKAALKVISIPQNSSDLEEMYSDGYDDESITSTFQAHLKSIVAEYSLMRKMNGNTNIVNCDDVRYVQHDDGIGWDIFIKMELLTPLTKVLPAAIPEAMVMKVAEDMCNALELCRKYDVIHRDIKPQNIFVSPNGDYKLGDFGIAKTVEKTMGGTKIGTYKYMAPEVYNNQPYNSAADIYSLGLVLYWMLNERRMPFLPLPPEKLGVGMEEAARHRRFSGEKLPPPAHGSEKLKRIVLKACAYDLKERYHTASEMLADLKGLDKAVLVSQPKPLKDDPRPVIIEEPNLSGGNGETEKPAPVPKPEEKRKRSVVAIVAGLAAMMILVFGAFFLSKKDPAAQENLPHQEDWSQWMDELPAYASENDYQIEEQTLYRFRNLNTTTSTTQSSMEGWELYDTIQGGSGFGPWSDWSMSYVAPTDTREVENQTWYRYRDKETTTGSASTMSGWTLYDTTYVWGEYGAWSSWSAAAAFGSESRKVETKTQYRYRDVTVTQEYTDWSAWSDWSDTVVTGNEYTKVETRVVYGYYYYLCQNCGAHMHGYGTCYTWAGGCGGPTFREGFCAIWSTLSWDNAGFGDWHGTGKFYTYIDGQLYFKWNDNGKPKTQYRYATRQLQDVISYGNWSTWSDTRYSSSESREVESRTVYRYCDRSQVATYHFYRWGDWSYWSGTPVGESDTREVESALVYRYRDQVTQTTYCFRKWSDWSEFSLQTAEPSDTVEVETKTQYRYKSK